MCVLVLLLMLLLLSCDNDDDKEDEVLLSPVKNELATLNTAIYPFSRIPHCLSISYIRSIRFEGCKSETNTAIPDASVVLY